MIFVEVVCVFINEIGDFFVDVLILFEGEEEIGLLLFYLFLEVNKDELKVDFVLVCDIGMWNVDMLVIFVMLCGMVGDEIIVWVVNCDLYFGYYGGLVQNFNYIVVSIIVGFYDENGKIIFLGFYDGVIEMLDDVMVMWNEFGFLVDDFFGEIGLKYL